MAVVRPQLLKMKKKVPIGLTAVLVTLLNSLILFSQDENYNSENFGNRSILLSGNVTGSVDDLGLTYYNPARIAMVENPAFSIDAKAYQYVNLKIKNAVGDNSELSSTRFQGIPSMLSGTFKIKALKDHHFAYTFLSRAKTNFNFNYSTGIETGDILEENEGGETFIGEIQFGFKETDEWYGLTWGKLITENFSVGVSVFASVYNYQGANLLTFTTLGESQNVNFYFNQFAVRQESYGMFWKVGLAWKLSKISLGLNIDLPYWEVHSNGKFKYQETLAGISNTEDIFKFADFNNISSSRKVPLGISIGSGVPIGKSTLHLKVDWHNKVDEYDRLTLPLIEDGTGPDKSFIFISKLRSVINFGLGAEVFITEKYKVFGSFSTDFSAAQNNANVFDIVGDSENDVNLDFDYLHLGFGFEINFNWGHLVLGTTYSSGFADFSQKLGFPDPNNPVDNEDDITKLHLTRWRGIIGAKIPVFMRTVEIK